MNQKYFCGVSISGMDKYIHAYFEATPESIASFIVQTEKLRYVRLTGNLSSQLNTV